MPMSPYVRSLRERIGHELLLLPGVTAVIRDGDRFLLARQRDTERWSLVGGGMEPGETPQQALAREVLEELGVTPVLGRIVGGYGGAALEATVPNGDRVAYVTTAYECALPPAGVELEVEELLEVGWFTRGEVNELNRHDWIDGVLDDAIRMAREGDEATTAIATAPCGWLTTLRADGSPHTTPVWFVLADDRIWVASAARNVKVKNLAVDDRVSVAVDGSGANPHVAQGRARVHEQIHDLPDVLALFARKYSGWDAADESQDGPRVLIEITIDRWLLGGAGLASEADARGWGHEPGRAH